MFFEAHGPRKDSTPFNPNVSWDAETSGCWHPFHKPLKFKSLKSPDIARSPAGYFEISSHLQIFYFGGSSSGERIFYEASHPLSPRSPAFIFPASGSFPMSWLFVSGGQSTAASASASVQPMNIWGWFPLGWTGLTSLQSEGLSRVFSNTTFWKHQFFGPQPSLWSNSHIHTWLLEKP